LSFAGEETFGSRIDLRILILLELRLELFKVN